MDTSFPVDRKRQYMLHIFYPLFNQIYEAYVRYDVLEIADSLNV